MTILARQVNGARNPRVWLRRGHRWLGLAAVFFVLFLSTTGIALNHSADWGLDRSYVESGWILDAYGVSAPAPTVSFAVGDLRVTQLGSRIYLGDSEVPQEVDAVVGLVALGPLAVVAVPDGVLVLTVEGDLVERIDLAGEMPGPVERLGRSMGRPVVASRDSFLIGDAEVTGFASLSDPAGLDIDWSSASEPDASEVAVLQQLYRGRGLTVERLLVEIHSGRILSAAGPWLLDIVGIGLIILSLSGIVVWLRGNGRGASITIRKD